MRFADYIVAYIASKGVDTAFIVTGGGSMHLNNAFAMSEDVTCYYFHHEQAAAMAAEGYARVSGKPCALNVTSGPGGLNSITGIFGAYTDSVPILVFSGQVKTDTLITRSPINGLRQLGDQETQVMDTIGKITKWSGQPQKIEDCIPMLQTMYQKATVGRPGPTWLDIPIDIQGQEVDEIIHEPLEIISNSNDISVNQKSDPRIPEILKKLQTARRPIILAGTGIRISNTTQELHRIAEVLQLPVCTAWTHDIFDNEHHLYAGRPGTIGTRAGNFVVQSADLVLVLGSRLNVRQISYNFNSFASSAQKIWVDIDPAELDKPFPNVDMRIQADLKTFIPDLLKAASSDSNKINRSKWVNWCQDINAKYTPKPDDYPISKGRINPYHFVSALFDRLCSDDIVICGNASATIIPYQIGKIKFGQRLISNSGCASMGYDLPAAIGAAIAAPDKRIICIAGDGSIMMNIQDMITIKNYNLKILIFILENDGYLSIKQTQNNFFGIEHGSTKSSGLMFPNFYYMSKACDLEYRKLDHKSYHDQLGNILHLNAPAQVIEVPCDLQQEFEPRLKSRQEGDQIFTPELDDMFPTLDRQELDYIRTSCLSI